MSAKAEAVEAIEQAMKALDSTEPLTGLRVRLLRETLAYAASAVEAIQELKRPRRKPKETTS